MTVQNSPAPVDGSDGANIGLSVLSVRKSGTPPFEKGHPVLNALSTLAGQSGHTRRSQTLDLDAVLFTTLSALAP